MRNVYVVTHPEATHHVDGLVGGWFDSALTERGMAQGHAIAESLAERLGDARVEVYASDLRRSRAAGEIVAQRLGAELTVDPDLRERSYGEAGGRPQAWLDERFIPAPAGADRLRHDEGVPGAETRWAVAQRAYAAMERIRASGAEHQVIVGHGGSATYLIAAWIGMPIESTGLVHFKLTSGGISLLREDPRGRQVTFLNETGHLR